MSSTSARDLRQDLTRVLSEHAHVVVHERRDVPGGTITVCHLSWTPGERSRPQRRTAVVLQRDDVDLPEFQVTPEIRWRLPLAGGLVDSMDIEVVEDPAFTEACFLFGMDEDSVRALFTGDVRAWFVDHPGWTAHGFGGTIVMYGQVETDSDVEQAALADTCTPIFERFVEAARTLGERPKGYQVEAEHFRRTAERIGGSSGRALRQMLRRIRITPEELEEFVEDRLPRDVPPGMRRQVLGQSWVLVAVGTIFAVAGLTVGGAGVAQWQGSERTIGILILILFPIAGGAMATFAWLHRRRRMRLLREGRLTVGRIESVRQTSMSVNDAIQYSVRVSYEHDGRCRTTKVRSQGPGADLASRRVGAEEPVRLLVDPDSPSQVICLDLLTVFE